MITAVDSSILVDVLDPDPVFGPSSREALRWARESGCLIVSFVVWAEVRAHFATDREHEAAMAGLEVTLSSLSPAAASRAGAGWREYRQHGGKRTRLVADFVVGAHALLQADGLLTRDRGFYRTYFASLALMKPEN